MRLVFNNGHYSKNIFSTLISVATIGEGLLIKSSYWFCMYNIVYFDINTVSYDLLCSWYPYKMSPLCTRNCKYSFLLLSSIVCGFLNKRRITDVCNCKRMLISSTSWCNLSMHCIIMHINFINSSKFQVLYFYLLTYLCSC